MKLGGGGNDRHGNWQMRHRIVGKQREAVGWLLKQFQRPPTPVVFTLTRIAPSAGLDDDNLAGSLKGVRDAIAVWMCVNDRKDDLVSYRYRNERGPYGLRIEA